MGYHLKPIKKGVYGEFSKIVEEMEELQDAHKQGIIVLELVELTDLIGAIDAYVAKLHLTMEDLLLMSARTKSAFQDGERKTTK